MHLVTDEARGLAKARNTGIALATGEIIAAADDDCEVEPDWLRQIARTFVADPAVGVVFGCVRAAPYDRQTGFIPAYEVRQPIARRGIGAKAEIEGIGADMASPIGVGAIAASTNCSAPAPPSGRRGHGLHGPGADRRRHRLGVPAYSRIHHGFRPWNEGPRLIANYMFGLGATNAKMLRLGKARAVKPIAALAWRWTAGHPVGQL